MALRVTLKFDSRTTRPFELPVTEEQFGDMRRAYWANREKDSKPDEKAALVLAKVPFRNELVALTKRGEKVMVRAIITLSLWVEGIYWYKERTPPASKNTRVRVFPDEEGNVYCPKCECPLMEDGEHIEEPVDFSKTMNNPRFICPHCNSMVMVSSRSEEYKERTRTHKS